MKELQYPLDNDMIIKKKNYYQIVIVLLKKTFAKPGSILGGEPFLDTIPGIEATTGSLGHGLSFGVGMALAKKIDNKDEKVYVLLGDGECEEGTIWEAVMFAAHQKLDNLIAIVDCNKIQKNGNFI